MTGGWRGEAACRNSDPRLFDSLEGDELRTTGVSPLDHPRIRQAVSICSSCPVAAACDAEADAVQAVGVWGARYRRLSTTPALSPKQRRAAKKRVAA